MFVGLILWIEPVSLAELVACCDDGDDGGGDTGSSTAGFAPIMHDFNIDLAAGQALAAQRQRFC